MSGAPLDLALVRRRDVLPDPIDYRRLRRSLDDGAYVRVAPGAYAPADAWSRLRGIERHRIRVAEAACRVRSPVLFSHYAAAAIWGMDILGSWPRLIDVKVGGASGGRSTGLIRRHVKDEGEAVPWGLHWVTTPAQTASDLAGGMSFASGVVMFDQALWMRRPGGALATREEVELVVDGARGQRGASRASRSLAFATDASDSVRESQSRVVLDRLGFPAPTLQRRFPLDLGRHAEVDFYFPDQDHVGEFDGIGKYFDPVFTRGKDPKDLLIAEKDREDAVRRQVSGFSRWRTPALDDPRILYDLLVRAGLPTRRSRPPRGVRWD